MLVSNSSQFLMVVNSACEKALMNTMDKLLDKLLEIIDKNVYSYQSTGEWNGRTGEFRKSWDKTKMEIIGQYMTSEISNENGKFTWHKERNRWSHGNWMFPLDELGEMAENINIIIDHRKGGENFNFPALQRPFWDEFYKWASINVSTIYQSELQKILGTQVVASAKIL